MKNPKFFYKIDGRGNPIPGTNVTAFKKPRTGLWRELENICCVEPEPEPEPCPDPNPPVLFTCINNQFYLSMEDENGIVTEFYTTGDSTYVDVLWQIPRGIYTITFYSVPEDQDVYINGVVVGTGAPGDVVLVDYDTTDITSMGYCPIGETIDVLVDFFYLQLNAPLNYTPEQVAERVQMRIYAPDGVTLLGQTVLGGGNNQTITGIPVGFVKIAVYTAAWEVDQLVSIFAGNIPYAGTTTVGASNFFPAGEFQDEAAYFLTSQYQVEARGTNSGGN